MKILDLRGEGGTQAGALDLHGGVQRIVYKRQTAPLTLQIFGEVATYGENGTRRVNLSYGAHEAVVDTLNLKAGHYMIAVDSPGRRGLLVEELR